MWGNSKITAKWIGAGVPNLITEGSVYTILWADTGGSIFLDDSGKINQQASLTSGNWSEVKIG